MPPIFHTLTHLLSSQSAFAAPFQQYDPREPRLGAVSSESTICSNIGIDLLKHGGNAADALVGTTFCVGVIGMYHSGIGGGGFMLVRTPEGTYEDIDFRETAPAAAFEDMYNGNVNGSIKGGLAAGVPGEVRGLQYLHEKYGKLSWEEVVMPAVGVAREGFEVGEDLVRFMEFAKEGSTNFLKDDPNWAIDFAPNDRILGIGDTMTRKRYATTLETIAKEGPDSFYEGPMANSMISTLQEKNGTMTLSDLKDYKVEIRKPAEIEYRGYKLHGSTSPASGSIALAIMKIVEGYDDFGWPEKLRLNTHRLDEAMRFGYAMRTKFGDPNFVSGLQHYENEILNSTTASETRNRISDFRTFNVSHYNPSGIEIKSSHGTSHVVAADASGLAITLTTTINLIFGSQVLDPSTGVIMNDEMCDFSIPHVTNVFGYVPSPSNYIRPGKRPMSSIAPVIVDDAQGRLYFVTGAAGGSRIVTASVLSLWHVLDRNMSVLEGLREPRFHDQLLPNLCVVESQFDNETVAFMKDRRHNVSISDYPLGSIQALRLWSNGTFEAAGEPRQKNSGGFAI